MITNITPKEKAEQLVNSFYYALPNNGSSTGLNGTTARYKEEKSKKSESKTTKKTSDIQKQLLF